MADVDILTSETSEFEVIPVGIEPSHANWEEEDSASDSPWLPELRKRLEILLNLRQNWDGEDGLPVRKDCAAIAAAVLEIASKYRVPKPHISPTPDGGVAFEITHQGRELGLDIEDDLSLGVLREHEDGSYHEKDIAKERLLSAAEREIQWLLRGS